MASIEEAVCWSGPAVFVLCTLGRAEARLPKGAFDVSGMRPDRVEVFRLASDCWAPGVVVWEYDLGFDDAGQGFVPYLTQCLRTASLGAEGIAWLAFEGTFHFDHLFTEDVAEHIYGYCVPGGEPRVTWDHDVLKGEGWRRAVAEVRAVLEDAFPAAGPQ
ncbi:hypothetical protein [Streptomyces griseosporeus]|uniref:hypothetical protein n=1 Tax=Streptomyces griseosporeus TaxID=1910 RepID=UPI003799C343